MGEKKKAMPLMIDPAKQKKLDNDKRVREQNAKDTKETKSYTAQREADIHSGKVKVSDHKNTSTEARSGNDQANERGDKKTFHAIDTMNPALMDKYIEEQTGGKAYAKDDD